MLHHGALGLFGRTHYLKQCATDHLLDNECGIMLENMKIEKRLCNNFKKVRCPVSG